MVSTARYNLTSELTQCLFLLYFSAAGFYNLLSSFPLDVTPSSLTAFFSSALSVWTISSSIYKVNGILVISQIDKTAMDNASFFLHKSSNLLLWLFLAVPKWATESQDMMRVTILFSAVLWLLGVYVLQRKSCAPFCSYIFTRCIRLLTPANANTPWRNVGSRLSAKYNRVHES